MSRYNPYQIQSEHLIKEIKKNLDENKTNIMINMQQMYTDDTVIEEDDEFVYREYFASLIFELEKEYPNMDWHNCLKEVREREAKRDKLKQQNKK